VIRFPKLKTPREPAYLAWLRLQRCAAPACASVSPPSEASHHGRHGTGIKPPDDEALPLCTACHRFWHARGEVPGAPTEREARRVWLRRIARRHWLRFQRSRSATVAGRRAKARGGKERRA